jgi:hypothetical protein
MSFQPSRSTPSGHAAKYTCLIRSSSELVGSSAIPSIWTVCEELGAGHETAA